MRINICQIDSEINAKKEISAEQSIKRIAKHIVKKIDNSFPEKQFDEWVNSDSEKPFKWKRNSYYWGNN